MHNISEKATDVADISYQMFFSANLTGRLNDTDMSLNGDGTIDEKIGRTEGAYIITGAPPGFSPYILGPMLITGYPNASKSLDGVANIFKGRAYRYSRKIHFRGGGCIELAAECVLGDGSLASTFRVGGTSPDMPVLPLEPLVELWEPMGPGKIRGSFTATWRTPRTAYMVADVVTDYEVDTSATQENILHRYVRMQTRVCGNRVEKFQDVLLFRDLSPLVTTS